MDCKYAVVQSSGALDKNLNEYSQSSGAHNFYLVSIVHAILPFELWSVTEASEETGM
jgi:hypothetical protein